MFDLIHNFFLEYKDENNMMVRNHQQIARRYIFRGPFIFYFLAQCPFHYFFDDKLWLLFKLLRLVRMQSIGHYINIPKMRAFFTWVFSNTAREKQVFYVHSCVIIYRILNRTLMSIGITYSIGCFWWLLSKRLHDDFDVNRNFINHFGLQDESPFR